MKGGNMKDIIKFLKELFSYKGRIGRLRFALDCLVAIGGVYAILFIAGLVTELVWRGSTAEIVRSEELIILMQVVSAAMFIPVVFSLIKRLHDMDYPTGLLLLALVPLANFILLLIVLFKKGTAGTNKYGDDPLT